MWYGPNGDDLEKEILGDDYIETGFRKKQNPSDASINVVLKGEEARSQYVPKFHDNIRLIDAKILEYENLMAQVEKERKDLISTCLFEAGGAVVVLLVTLFFDRMALMDISMIFYILTFLGLCAFVHQVFRTLKQVANLWVRSHRGSINTYIEMEQIKTFEKEEQYYLSCIKELTERKQRIRTLIQKVERYEDLDGADVAFALSARSLVIVRPCRYTETSCNLFKYLFQR